jgi:hypothetical protein
MCESSRIAKELKEKEHDMAQRPKGWSRQGETGSQP